MLSDVEPCKPVVELVELVDISRTGRRREADGLRAPLRRAVGRRVTAVGRADKQHDDERRDHYGLAQAACGVAGAVVVRRLGSRWGEASREPGAGGRRAGRRNYSWQRRTRARRQRWSRGPRSFLGAASHSLLEESPDLAPT